MNSGELFVPEVPLSAARFRPDGVIEIRDAERYLDDMVHHAMGLCFDMAEEALADGNPPVGAVLLHHDLGLQWGARTVDKTEGDILGHGELRAYNEAKATVGNQLERCTLVTTAQPCNTCTAPYAEGKIGRIVYAAPRMEINEVSGLMRQRRINLPDLLADGNTDTIVVEGYQAERALGLFALWGKLRAAGKVNG